VLREAGHQVQLERHGPDALARVLRSDTPLDLLIADTALAGMPGLELARRAALEGFTGQSILLSGGASAEAPVPGVFAIVPKPVGLDDLECVVRRALAGASRPPFPIRRTPSRS
jgi:DNA-binding NtrC family response regulator